MRIIRKNGTIIELTTEEYKKIYGIGNTKKEIENHNIYTNTKQKINTKIESKSKKPEIIPRDDKKSKSKYGIVVKYDKPFKDMTTEEHNKYQREYMREYRKIKRNRPETKNTAKHVGGYGKRISNCKKWKKSEEKILRQNSGNPRKAMNELKGRSYIAVYTRMSKKELLKTSKRYDRKDKAQLQKRMKKIYVLYKNVKKQHPEFTRSDAMKQAHKMYKTGLW